MPLTFTTHELLTTTVAAYSLMPPATQAAFNAQLDNLWCTVAEVIDTEVIGTDYVLVDSNRRFELGE